jgi:hypothetical protein
MLSEILHVRQVAHDYFRRSFGDDNLNLLVWYKPDGTPCGFELSYDSRGRSRAFRWLEDGGFFHGQIDGGEESVFANRSPTLTAEGGFDALSLLSTFDLAAEKLPVVEKDLVRQKLLVYGIIAI